jgi:hypothetical protein
MALEVFSVFTEFLKKRMANGKATHTNGTVSDPILKTCFVGRLCCGKNRYLYSNKMEKIKLRE